MCPINVFCAAILVFLVSIMPLTAFATKFQTSFSPDNIKMKMATYQTVNLTMGNININEPGMKDAVLQLRSDKPHIADVQWEMPVDKYLNGTPFNVSGYFLGRTNILLQVKKQNNETIISDDKLQVVVTRAERVIDHVFTGSVALLVSVLYINFGAAIEMSQLREILRRPIGPVIGFFSQFLVMPLLSFALAHLLFEDYPAFQLGLFFTGVSPAGGASNIWTVVLGGNLNLSIAMTTISTIAAFGMMPLWIFTLGRVIFDRGNLGIPYSRISYLAIGLIIPLGIGMLIQKYFPRVGKLLVRILKPTAAILILFIVIFAIITNLYLFELFSWRIIIAGLVLPGLGYFLGWILAKVFKQKPEDALAIAIETGIQNTGIAIFLLRFTLPQPDADLTTVIPVAVAIMTPLPLMLIYIVQKVGIRYKLRGNRELITDDDTEQK